jgi:hypothetical protein
MQLIQTSQTGGQQYSDTSPFRILWFVPCKPFQHSIVLVGKYYFCAIGFQLK